MFRGSTLVLALLFIAPEFWRAITGQAVSLDALIVHYLIAVVVAGVLLGIARAAMRPRQRSTAERPRR